MRSSCHVFPGQKFSHFFTKKRRSSFLNFIKLIDPHILEFSDGSYTSLQDGDIFSEFSQLSILLSGILFFSNSHTSRECEHKRFRKINVLLQLYVFLSSLTHQFFPD